MSVFPVIPSENGTIDDGSKGLRRKGGHDGRRHQRLDSWMMDHRVKCERDGP